MNQIFGMVFNLTISGVKFTVESHKKLHFMQWINFNGEIMDEMDPVFSATDHLIYSGDSLIEHIRVINGKMPLLNQHINRLELSMHLLHMEPDRFYTAPFFEKEINKVLEKNVFKNAAVTLLIYRKRDTRYQEITNTTGYLITVGANTSEKWQINAEGLKVDFYPEHFIAHNHLSGLSTSTNLIHTLATIWKEANTFDNVIILNKEGRVVEAAGNSVLIFYKNELLFPVYTEGGISEIMRENVLPFANRMNIDCRATYLTKEMMMDADEIFLLNTIDGLQWVGEIEGKRYGNNLAKELVEHLNSFLR